MAWFWFADCLSSTIQLSLPVFEINSCNSKSEQEDIAAEEIQQIVAEFDEGQKDKQVDND
jgi:hypothetical protein